MNAQWRVRSASVPMSRAAEISGIDLPRLAQFSLRGLLGAPRRPAAPASMTPFELAAAMAIGDGLKLRLAPERIAEAAVPLGGAALIHFAAGERKHWTFNGSPEAVHTFWTSLKPVDGASSPLREVLMLGDLEPKRFAAFSDRSVRQFDDLSELEAHTEWPIVLIDAFDISRRLRRVFPGPAFVATHQPGS